MATWCCLLVCVATALLLDAEASNNSLLYVHFSDLPEMLKERCALLGLPSHEDDSTARLLDNLYRIYSHEPAVLIAWVDPTTSSETILPAMPPLKRDRVRFVLYRRTIKDRSCLLPPPSQPLSKAEPYEGELSVDGLVGFVNDGCETFRTSLGTLLGVGVIRNRIMENLYHVEEVEEVCQRIKMPDKALFFREYLLRSRPVVIEGAVDGWPARTKWSSSHLLEQYGDNIVHVKLTPEGSFEGVESAALWEGYSQDRIPSDVRWQLQFPDMVVVRPASAEMKFSSFLDLITAVNRSYSAYLEYSSIPYYMPKLEKDIQELPFLGGILRRHHLNMWLSDGKTLGKLHFDPYDNMLCQLSGVKKLTLFDPHQNENLYEGHIPEAMLSFNPRTNTFRRQILLESTSMVMSPIDLGNPDLTKFPNFTRAKRMKCVLGPGDALFMPAFWWHEVQSYPDAIERRNLAINYWYEPILDKEFPCPTCRLHFNMYYGHLLEELKF